MSARRTPPPPRPVAPGASALAAAARVVMTVAHDGRSADVALADLPQGPERSAIRAIALGSLRWYLRLAPAVAPLLKRPVAEMSPVLHALLIAGAHQIVYSRGAPEVSVHLAVDAARLLRQPQATGMVNAVLRRFVAERERLLADADRRPAARFAVPRWFYDRLIADWDEPTALQVLAAGNLHPPMTLRVDLSRVSRADYLQQLAASGLQAQGVEWCESAIVLQQPASVASLPGFAEGRVSVQDAGAQLAGSLLELAPGQRVLDACAAPGGKSGHLLELANGQIALTAIDIDGARLAMMRENFRRLGREADCVQADLSKPLPQDATWAQPNSYDRILLDAPCTATGVLRRHPDIRLLRRPSDVAAFAAIQTRLLQQCFALLRPGGRLLYSTCSILKLENEGVVGAFVASESTASVLPLRPLALPSSHRMLQCGMTVLPGNQAETDGFYYAALTKVAKAQHS
jgi:16S rRNA (cytosine967-C5)-methyltransferase